MPRPRRWWFVSAGLTLGWVGVDMAPAQEQVPAPAGKVYFDAGKTPLGEPVTGLPVLGAPPPPAPVCNGHGGAAANQGGGGLDCKAKHEQAQYLCRKNFVGFLPEFNEPSLGTFLYAHCRTMVVNGEAARMTLYNYDFECDGERLNCRGHYQLKKIVDLLMLNDAPVVIECTPCRPELAEARRLMVLLELGQVCPLPVPPERVVVGRATAIGLRGVEAELVYRNLLLQTQRLGQGTAGGGAGGGAAGGAAFGGAAGRTGQ